MSQVKKILQSFISQYEWENEMEIEQHTTVVHYTSAIRISGEDCSFRLASDDEQNRILMYVCVPLACLDGQTNETLRLLNHLNNSIPFGCVYLDGLSGPAIFRAALELTGSVASVESVMDMFAKTMRVMACWIPPIKAVSTTVTTADQAYQDACRCSAECTTPILVH